MKDGDLFYRYDPKIGRRVVHVFKGGFAISLVTGHKVKINKEMVKDV